MSPTPLGLLLSVLFFAAVTPAATGAEKTEVLIYYANETAPDEAEARNYDTIINWLETSDLELARSLAHGLKQDRELFPAAVDDEIAAIQAAAAQSNDPVPAILFTNRLVRSGRCLVFHPESSNRFEVVEVPRLTHANEIINSNPLSQPEALSRMLAVAARQFDPAKHEFVLITKSHGGPKHALTLKLGRRASELSREELLQHLAAGTSDAPAAVIGTTRHEYVEVLKRTGLEQGMTFRLVCAEACQGTIDQPLAKQLPANVMTLVLSGSRYLSYRTLDYGNLLRGVTRVRPLSSALTAFLSPNYLTVTHSRSGSFTSWGWFAPIVVWGLWLGLPRKRRAGRAGFNGAEDRRISAVFPPRGPLMLKILTSAELPVERQPAEPWPNRRRLPRSVCTGWSIAFNKETSAHRTNSCAGSPAGSNGWPARCCRHIPASGDGSRPVTSCRMLCCACCVRCRPSSPTTLAPSSASRRSNSAGNCSISIATIRAPWDWVETRRGRLSARAMNRLLRRTTLLIAGPVLLLPLNWSVGRRFTKRL